MKPENYRRNFIPRNEGFVCEQCGATVPPARGTFRNHCPACLTSKHVDGDVPGDRTAHCQGLMPVVRREGVDPDHLDLVHHCEDCDHIRRNRTAPDDSHELVLALPG